MTGISANKEFFASAPLNNDINNNYLTTGALLKSGRVSPVVVVLLLLSWNITTATT